MIQSGTEIVGPPRPLQTRSRGSPYNHYNRLSQTTNHPSCRASLDLLRVRHAAFQHSGTPSVCIAGVKYSKSSGQMLVSAHHGQQIPAGVRCLPAVMMPIWALSFIPPLQNRWGSIRRAWSTACLFYVSNQIRSDGIYILSILHLLPAGSALISPPQAVNAVDHRRQRGEPKAPSLLKPTCLQSPSRIPLGRDREVGRDRTRLDLLSQQTPQQNTDKGYI